MKNKIKKMLMGVDEMINYEGNIVIYDGYMELGEVCANGESEMC